MAPAALCMQKRQHDLEAPSGDRAQEGKGRDAQSPVVRQLVDEQVAELLQQRSLGSACASFCSEHAGASVRHATAAAQALVAADPAKGEEAGQLIASFRSGSGVHRRSASRMSPAVPPQRSIGSHTHPPAPRQLANCRRRDPLRRR